MSKETPIETSEPITIDAKGSATIRPSKYSKWRAATLATVYVLFIAHFVHWKLAGKTLAPLEVHEVMYTLELGVITGGFILMALAFVSAVVVGRFFCSWGCHLLALEDLCAWILKKVGIRPKPVRSRLLLLVPIGAFFYMIIWPQITRLVVHIWPATTNLLGARPDFQIRVLSDAEGWASFVTTDYWRNLPGPFIGIATLAICGFAIVYILGSRSFCTYACPYGVIFGFMDRFSAGRLVMKGECTECGHCTAVCNSGIRVHEEVKQFGKVVSPGCLKDLDCVSACPTEGLKFGFTKPALFKSLSKGRPPIRYNFTRGEEILMIVVFVASVYIFRGLYSLVPFLMTLGIGVILAMVAVLGLRLIRQSNVRLNNLQLKMSGHMTRWGKVFGVAVALLAVFVLHSAFIRYHEFQSIRTFDHIQEELAEGSEPEDGLVTKALGHLETRERWGLLKAADIDWRTASLHLFGGSAEIAEERIRKILEKRPHDLGARLQLARVLLGTGRMQEAKSELHVIASATPRSEFDAGRLAIFRSEAHRMLGSLHATDGRRDAAIVEFRSALAEDSGRPSVHLALGELLAAGDELTESIEHFKAATALKPEMAAAHYNLGVVLAMDGRDDEALVELREAVELDPTDPQAHSTLGRLLARQGMVNEAEEQFREVIALEPNNAQAHRNLARILMDRGLTEEAETHLERARRIEGGS
jgi:Flp pilus assembly protein TadD